MKALVDYRMKRVFLEYFKNRKIECIMVSCSDIYDEISGHPDIFFTSILGNEVMAENVKISKKLNCSIGEKVEKCYPETAKYNVVVNEKFVIGNFKYLEKSVKNIIENSNLKMINVNQGYTRCSLFSLDYSHYITSDRGIKKALERENLNVLYIENEDIKLLDKDGNYSKMQGFIGGAMAKIGKDVLLFGDKNKLKSGLIIEEYVTNLGYNFVDFKDEDVIDYGSVIIVD